MRDVIKPHQQISFIEAFLGLTLAPSFTTRKLMANGHRSFAPTCLICLLLTLFVPLWAQVIKYRLVDFGSAELLSVVAATITALGLYYIFGLLLTALLRFDINVSDTLKALTYALTPINLSLWLVYGFNYAYSGRLTIVTYILTGAGNVHDLFFGQLPIAACIIALWVLLVAFYCFKYGTSDLSSQSLAYALLLAPANAMSLALGAFVGDVIRPGFFSALLHLILRFP